MDSSLSFRLRLSLFSLRLGVFVVMFFWTLDKLIRPEHASQVFENFYSLGGLEQHAMKVIGILEMILLAGFLVGIKKRFTYGAVLILHAVSTFSSYKQYFAPFDKGNLLFFAAWPMLAACLAIYLLREEDNLFTLARR